MNSPETGYYQDQDNKIKIIVKSHFDEHVIELSHYDSDSKIIFVYGNKQIKGLADFLYSIIGEKK
jgi:hypothetical protein